jgi:hypothetical protein
LGRLTVSNPAIETLRLIWLSSIGAEPLNEAGANTRYILGALAKRFLELACQRDRRARMRWFYIFLLVLAVWGGFVQVALKDDLRWQMWSGPDTPVS